MQPVPEHHRRSTFHRRLLAVFSVLTVCTSCAAPRRAPIDDPCIAASVLGRASSVAELETALALADLGPLAVPRPSSPATLDPASSDFWFTCAYLYEPGVRQARRKLEAKRALARGAGAVPSINAGVDHVGPGNSSETDVMASLDLLALLGLGPAAAAKELARADVCEALADLESAVWAARFRVQRARARLEAAAGRAAVAAEIGKDAAEDETRITTLEQGGRGAPADIAWARATRERIKLAGQQARVEAALAREELAVSSGLPPDHSAIVAEIPGHYVGGVDALPWCDYHLVHTASTDAPKLLTALPRLRALKMKYAAAEARVRAAAAATWPSLQVGPKFRFVPDAFLTGGVVDVNMPLPAVGRAQICAALIDRTAAREALEDELVKALARNRSLNQQKEALIEQIGGSIRLRSEAAERMWKAARARFLADDSALNGWALALDMRLEASLAAIATREAEELAEIDISEASPWNLEIEWGQEAESRP